MHTRQREHQQSSVYQVYYHHTAVPSSGKLFDLYKPQGSQQYYQHLVQYAPEPSQTIWQGPGAKVLVNTLGVVLLIKLILCRQVSNPRQRGQMEGGGEQWAS